MAEVEGSKSFLAHLDVVRRDIETLLFLVAQNLGKGYDASDLSRVAALIGLEARMRVLLEALDYERRLSPPGKT